MNVTNVADLTITTLETITAFDPVTGNFRFSLDELQDATIAQTQDAVDVVGKLGRKLNTLKRNKAVTISGTHGLVSAGLLELQTGNEFSANIATTVKWMDNLAVLNNSATTSFIAVGTPGAEIDAVYIKNNNNTLGTRFEQGAAVDEGVFIYDPATRIIEFENDAIADGAEIVVFYMRRINGSVLDNHSDKFSGKCSLFVDAFAEDTCANIYRVQFHIPLADFNGNFDLAMGGDSQTVHAFEAEALGGACATAGLYWSMTIFGAEDGDLDE